MSSFEMVDTFPLNLESFAALTSSFHSPTSIQQCQIPVRTFMHGVIAFVLSSSLASVIQR
jgi:hypothetical protein